MHSEAAESKNPGQRPQSWTDLRAPWERLAISFSQACPSEGAVGDSVFLASDSRLGDAVVVARASRLDRAVDDYGTVPVDFRLYDCVHLAMQSSVGARGELGAGTARGQASQLQNGVRIADRVELGDHTFRRCVRGPRSARRVRSPRLVRASTTSHRCSIVRASTGSTQPRTM